MKKRLDLYIVKNEFIEELKKIDFRVQENKGQKRPYVGVLFQIDKINYFAPLASPKPKHLTMKNGKDFMKIDKGRLGVVNLNNMIPISNLEKVEKISLSVDNKFSETEKKYKNLLIDQYNWLNSNKFFLQNKATILHKEYKEGTLNSFVVNRCINFIELENYLINKNQEQSKEKDLDNKTPNINVQDNQEKPQFSIASLRQQQQEIDNKNQLTKVKKKSR